MTAATPATEGSPSRRGPSRPYRALTAACLAHALHDGFTDLLYVLLPVWQAQFGLSYSALAVLRGLFVGAMAALQVPSSHLAERRIGARDILALGTASTAAGFALASFSAGLLSLGVSLALAGAGSSTQHPLASAAVSRAYGAKARAPLGVYNFAGDLGKAAFPLAASLLLALSDWRATSWTLAGLGFAIAVAIRWLMPVTTDRTVAPTTPTIAGLQDRSRSGFGILLAVGVLDSAVRMAFLLFLPFLLRLKGAELPTVGLALSLVFIGGALGKLACGWLGARLGLLTTVLGTEVGTAAAILGVLALPLMPALAVLPLLGIMLNGTSSVLYGAVPDLVPPDRIGRAFAFFYTGTLGSSAFAPTLYGLLGDIIGPARATEAVAATALMILPLTIALSPHLQSPSIVRDP